jgi:hypothetical protein
VGKAQKRKGKRLFMPMRIVFTGRMQVGQRAGGCACHACCGLPDPATPMPRHTIRCPAIDSCLPPLRGGCDRECVAVTVKTVPQGPDIGETLAMLLQHNGEAAEGSGFVGLPERMEQLRKAALSL